MSKREIHRSIVTLSEHTRFAIVFGEYAGGRAPTGASSHKFPADGRPVSATLGNKRRAGSFLDGRRTDALSDLIRDVGDGLEAARRLDAPKKVLIYVGDGQILRGDPAAAVAEITARNTGKVQINTVGVSPYPRNEAFLKELAAANGGRYRRIGG